MAAFLAFLLLFPLLGMEELKINGILQQPDQNGMPAGWMLHPWKGFEPVPEIQYTGGGKPRVRFSKIQAAEGFAFRTARKIAGKSGDQVELSFSAQGKGRIYAHLYLYDKKGGWNGITQKRSVLLTGKKQCCSFLLPVVNGSKRETSQFCIVIGAFPRSEFEIWDIHASLIPGEIKGDIPFPRTGVAFGPVPEDFQPEEKDFRSIPDILAGVKGRKQTIQNNKIDFRPILGKQNHVCGWFFAELDSPYESDYTIGAGADWWMKVYVNGKPVIDTLESGNKFTPCGIDNYKPVVRLKKGCNIIAVKLIRGKSSAALWIGGPVELRKAAVHLILEKVLEKDDYEELSLNRAGNPELIQGLPSPGMLSLTTQGVYTASPEVEFPLSTKVFDLDSLASDRFFTMGLRIQNFGRKMPVSSRLEYRFRNRGRSMTLAVVHDKTKPFLNIILSIDGMERKIGAFSVAMLPVNLSFSLNRNGNGFVSVGSMSRGSVLHFPVDTGNFFRSGKMNFTFAFCSGSGGPAEITVDERFYGISMNKQPAPVPHKLMAPPTFDPEKAGWKKVFADEFDGDRIDMTKWIFRKPPTDRVSLDGKGHLVLTTDYDKKHKKLLCPGIGTRKSYGYGYFEARLRFTKQPGWWAAFWLYGSNSFTNPFIDGIEVDIFEDYYTRPKKKGLPFGKTLDHNIHSPVGNVTKSWNFNSQIPGSIEDFHTVGCLYTPFEIALYLDGKRIRNADSSSKTKYVGFNAFTHSTANTPLQAILSGLPMGSRWSSKAEDGVFPEHYLIDFVRIYEMPTDDLPVVSWKKGNEINSVKAGDILVFEADVKPSPKTGSPIKTVYLFDSGNLIDFKTRPPYRFEVPFTQAFYDTTDFSKPGRQNRKPSLLNFHHAFVIFAQDESGKTGFSTSIIAKLASKGKSTPWQGKIAELPGKIVLSRYDEGGRNVGYFDTDSVNRSSRTYRTDEGVDCSASDVGHTAWGEWLNYTVNTAESGEYEAVLLYGTPREIPKGITLKEDDRVIGYFDLKANPSAGWQVRSFAKTKVRLTKGIHVLTVEINGGCNLKTIEFRLMQGKSK